MKEHRIYREFFNLAIAKERRPSYFEIDENFICVTDGYKGYKLLARQFPLNLNFLRKMDAVSLDITDKHTKLKRTEDLRDISRGSGGFQAAIKFKADNFNVWINRKLLELFDNPTLYGTHPHEACIVCELDKPVGIVLPVRIKED